MTSKLFQQSQFRYNTASCNNNANIGVLGIVYSQDRIYGDQRAPTT